MKIEHENLDTTGRFYIKGEGEVLAEMDYKMQDKNILLITHTEVSESLAGKGVGKQLVGAGVEYAREKSLKVKSVCSFAKAILDKPSEFADVYNAAENKS